MSLLYISTIYLSTTYLIIFEKYFYTLHALQRITGGDPLQPASDHGRRSRERIGSLLYIVGAKTRNFLHCVFLHIIGRNSITQPRTAPTWDTSNGSPPPRSAPIDHPRRQLHGITCTHARTPSTDHGTSCTPSNGSRDILHPITGGGVGITGDTRTTVCIEKTAPISAKILQKPRRYFVRPPAVNGSAGVGIVDSRLIVVSRRSRRAVRNVCGSSRRRSRRGFGWE